MAYEKRQTEQPSPKFLSQALAQLSMAFPKANLTREVIERLYPLLLREWRAGQNAYDAAKAVCSCDEVHLLASPASETPPVNRLDAYPPKGAKRGDVFGLEEVRGNRQVERAQNVVAKVQSGIEKLRVRIQRLESARPKTPDAQAKRDADLTSSLNQLAETEANLRVVTAALNATAESRPFWKNPKAAPPKTPPAKERRAKAPSEARPKRAPKQAAQTTAVQDKEAKPKKARTPKAPKQDAAASLGLDDAINQFALAVVADQKKRK